MSGELLALPAPRAVAVLGLALLEEARAALPRVLDARDAEGLHDLRVALRRLRSLLRTYRDHLDAAVPNKRLRRLRTLAHATNAARDLEVTVAWLDSEFPAFTDAAARAGADAWREWAEAQRLAAYHTLEQELARCFDKTIVPLHERLDRLRRADHQAPPFAPVTADLLCAHSADLRHRLAAIASPWDEQSAHAARIAGKRLRYLLTPLRGCRPCKAAEKVLKGLQDVLGDLHDAHVRSHAIGDAAAALGAEWARGELERVAAAPGQRVRANRQLPALVAVARHNRRQVAALYRRLDADWLQSGGDLFVVLDAAAAHLAGP